MSVTAYYWYLRLRGFEIDEVEFARKSFGHSYAIYKATSNPVMLTSLLCKLVEKMGKRLRNAGYNAQGIHMSLEYSDYSFWHHGHTTAVKMYASNELYRQARKLMFSAPDATAVLTPITWPEEFTSGPPLLPGLIAASV